MARSKMYSRGSNFGGFWLTTVNFIVFLMVFNSNISNGMCGLRVLRYDIKDNTVIADCYIFKFSIFPGKHKQRVQTIQRIKVRIFYLFGVSNNHMISVESESIFHLLCMTVFTLMHLFGISKIFQQFPYHLSL